MASTYLERTPSTAGNLRKATLSVWFKISKIDSHKQILSQGAANHTSSTYVFIRNDNVLSVNDYDGSDQIYVATNRKLRDTNAWYHLVVAFDTTQATASDRVKIWINGVQETSFSSSTYPSQNFDLELNSTDKLTIGRRPDGNDYFDGSMSHYHFCDGYAYSASDFGETDSTTGQWKIKTNPSVSYGTNGFWVLKDGNSATDQSGNGNDLTVGGTLTNTEDNPSNVFTTLNPLVRSSVSKTYGHGNNSITASASGDWCSTQSTMAASSGKYYCEIKVNAVGSFHAIGVGYLPNITNANSIQLIGELTGSAGWRNNGVLPHGGSNINTYTTGDILMIAMDLDNQKLYFGKNGTWENSGDPTSGATGTGSLKDLTANEFYHFVICPRGGSTYCNFGNGYFGTTAITSEGTNASGIGKFEYNVPAGYTALSTKGLNE